MALGGGSAACCFVCRRCSKIDMPNERTSGHSAQQPLTHSLTHREEVVGRGGGALEHLTGVRHDVLGVRVRANVARPERVEQVVA